MRRLCLYVITLADSTNVLNLLDSLHLWERTMGLTLAYPRPLRPYPPSHDTTLRQPIYNSDSLYIIWSRQHLYSADLHAHRRNAGKDTLTPPNTRRTRGRWGRGREGRQDLVGGRYLTDFYYLCTANETTEEAGSFLRSLYSIATEQTKVKEEDCQ